jgi:dolichyl-phosphate beta-glucosyltransferase
VGDPELALVVPVFDEAARLGDFADLLIDYAVERPGGVELLFVDDGSTDATADLLEASLGARAGVAGGVLRRPHLGKGAAVAAGLAAVDAPLAAFCDLDLSTPLDQLDVVVATAARAGGLAIASRDLAGSRLARPEGQVRELLGKAYNRLLQATVTPGVVDTQCGAKAAPTEVWQALLAHTREVGFAWDAELVAVALALGVGVHEVPVEWRHDDRSKIRVGRDGARMVRAVPRIHASRRRARAAATVSTRVADGATHVEVFDDRNAAELAAADRDHWWFRSKAALVATAIRRTARAGEAGQGWLLDIGGGAGGVTALLGWRPDRVVVVEGNAALCAAARDRHGLGAAQANVDRVPIADSSASVVCLLDVIEHLAAPGGALAEARRVLAPGGRLVVNVPGHQWLWSAADETLGHVRRYTRATLRAELVAAGFEPLVLGHVFSWLVPPVWWRRRLRSTGEAELGLDVASPAIDRAAMVLTWGERLLVGRAAVPFGTSVLAVAIARG